MRQNSLRSIPVLLLAMATQLAGQKTALDLRTQTRNVDFSSASATKPYQMGTALPTVCSQGQIFFLSTAAAGKNTYGCTATNVWTLQSGSGLPDFSSSPNSVLSNDGVQAVWRGIGGDVAGAPQALQVQGLRGRTVAPSLPSDGQVLRWSIANSDWEPGSVQNSVNFAKNFSSQAAVTIAGTEHNLGSANLIVSCYSSASPSLLLPATAVAVDPASYNVTVTFGSAQSGRCVVNGLGGSGISASGGGDLSGAVSNATVTGLQNRALSPTQPTDGQVLTWSEAAGQWQPRLAAAGTGGGSGTSQLNVLGVSYVNSTTLTIGAGCSTASPCNLRFGGTAISFTSSSTVTLQSGSGTAYIYVTPSGGLTVGTTLNVACTGGCVTAAGVVTFPFNVIPLYSWTANNNVWDPSSGRDLRSYLSTKQIGAGTGIVVIESGPLTTIAMDAAVIPTYIPGEATLNFGSVAAGTCSAELSISAPGASVGDPVAAGWPASLPGNVIGMMRVSATGSVAVRLCNLAGTASSIPTDVYRATIVRSL